MSAGLPEIAPESVMEEALAQSVLELVSEAAVVLRVDGTPVYLNGAAAVLFGLSRALLTAAAAHAALAAWRDDASDSSLADLITRGRRWSGGLTEREGARVTRQRHATLTPQDGSAGHDLLILIVRDLASQGLDDMYRAAHEADRAILMAVMHDVRPERTVEATSNALCQAVARIDGIDGAMLFVLPPKGDLVHLTTAGIALPGFDFGSRVPLENLAPLIDMTQVGPWHVDLVDPATRELLGGDLVEAMLDKGITATGYASIRQDTHLIGVLAVATTAQDGASMLERRLGSLEQVGAFAGMVLANQAILFGQDEAMRTEIRRLIAQERFLTFVQPVIELSTGRVVGLEALTRFDDGRNPSEWFFDAHAVDVGIELEEACAAKALASVPDLDPDVWLAINFSPFALISGSVARLAQVTGRRFVVEITEHSAIDSYEEIRLAMSSMPDIEVSIDDAGAGFASLRHILELSPEFVKLDIGMVRDVDTDPSRAAMVAGMCHFAAATGTRLIAEGIETAGEAATLRDLGVELGQGYFFDRPAPFDVFRDRL